MTMDNTKDDNAEQVSSTDWLGPFAPIPEWMFGPGVEARNALQRSGRVHPYTCGNNECRSKTNQAPLLAVEGGWLCEHCGYEQRNGPNNDSATNR
jgi:hypothetical protein